MTVRYDYLIKNAKVFDGRDHPVFEDIGIADGRIAARQPEIDAGSATRVIDAKGQWAMPGLFDIHTHYDLELEVAPGLPESTRHGTTTVVIANCSLGLAFGNQRKDGADPIVDCYARVENIPKQVLADTAERVDWQSPGEYLEHLENLNLGPNVVTLMPHSMLRIEAMGFQDSISRDPDAAELEVMKERLAEGLDLGYAGFSTDALPFHYLANQPNTHKTIPTQFAKYGEIKALTNVVRDRDGVWQATPPKDSIPNTIRTFLLTSGRIHGKALKTTVVAALDIHCDRKIVRMARLLARALNSSFLKGKFFMQALGAPFKTWSDGAITPLAEEIPELRRLNETELEDREERRRILADPDYIKAFRKMWMCGKQGFNLDRLRHRLRMEDFAFNRELSDMTVEVCPQKSWEGRTLEWAYHRLLDQKAGCTVPDMTDEERQLLERDFFWVADEADFMIQLLRTFDTDLTWSTVSANRDPQTIRDLIMDPSLLPGFNDSGAHLTNMAFYDVNLRSLRLAAEGGDRDLAYMVRRLTKDAAKVFGVEGGTINVGGQADLILVDPEQLMQYDGQANVQRIWRDEFRHEQLVNRSDDVVPMVMIGGQIAWENNEFSESLGKTPMGRLKRGLASRHEKERPRKQPGSEEKAA